MNGAGHKINLRFFVLNGAIILAFDLEFFVFFLNQWSIALARSDAALINLSSTVGTKFIIPID